ncbi:MAG: hypothetical protein MHM6MM_001163 [Cercozoa sp. M6MM]
MHIKKVVIEGFRSYKTRTVVEFDPRHNVIVGKNGAGKSNVFKAIQFVLSDEFQGQGREMRARILHDGSGRPVMAASVELFFDNTDRRLPIDQDEVSIRRSIGLKKDEFFLNGAYVARSNIDSLLETAGLSRRKPYNIVPQGRVAALITMTDKERLEMLKQIAGTRKYEEQRREAKRNLQEAATKVTEIADVIAYIETRLEELQTEQQLLRQFQELDQKRRVLEFSVYDKDRTVAEHELAECDRSKNEQEEIDTALAAKLEQARQDCAEAERKIVHADAELERLQTREHARLIALREECVAEHAHAEEALQQALKQQETSNQKSTEMRLQLAQMEKRFSETVEKLKKLRASETEKREEVDELSAQFAALETELQALGFKSQAERDEALTAQLTELRERFSTLEENERVARKNSEKLKRRLAELTEECEIKENEAEQLKQTLAQHNAALDKLNKQRGQVFDAKQLCWRNQEEAREKRDSALRAEKHSRDALSRMMVRDMAEAQSEMRKICDQHDLWYKEDTQQGVLGSVIELLKYDSRFELAIETVAHNQLMQWVVTDDSVAAQCIRLLQQSQKSSGRITFMPLNRLRQRMRVEEYPRSADVAALVDQIQFTPLTEPAMRQIFGRTLVAETLASAKEYAERHRFDCVTLDGDQVSRRNEIRGGYTADRARLRTQREIHAQTLLRKQADAEFEEAKKRAALAEEKLSRINADFNSAQDSVSQARQKIRALNAATSALRSETSTLQREIAQFENAGRTHERKIQIQGQVGALEKALQQPFNASNTQTIESVESQLQETAEQRDAAKDALMKLSAKCNSVAAVQEQLSPRIEELRAQMRLHVSSARMLDDEEDSEEDDALAERTKVEQIAAKIAHFDQRLAALSTRRDELQKQSDEMRQKADAAQKIIKSATTRMRKQTRGLDKLYEQRKSLQQRVEECNAKIQSLGSLPGDVYEREHRQKIARKSRKSLLNELSTVQRKLAHKRFRQVNKKAVNQFVDFTQRRQALHERKLAQEKSLHKILQLIKHLDEKKSGAIQRTFNGVAKHFGTVFGELVPGGQGEVVIHQTQRQLNESIDTNDSDDEEAMLDDDLDSQEKSHRRSYRSQTQEALEMAKSTDEGEQYAGVEIRVSFNEAGAVHTMASLSGGQQTVTALALILAIQRCDPSPFYLFDEIDSNLDAVYRTAVANIIHRGSEGRGTGDKDDSESSEDEMDDDDEEDKKVPRMTQFIATTFRPEMLVTAHRCFAVTFGSNKVSRVDQISRSEAQQIIRLESQTSMGTPGPSQEL